MSFIFYHTSYHRKKGFLEVRLSGLSIDLLKRPDDTNLPLVDDSDTIAEFLGDTHNVGGDDQRSLPWPVGVCREADC